MYEVAALTTQDEIYPVTKEANKKIPQKLFIKFIYVYIAM